MLLHYQFAFFISELMYEFQDSLLSMYGDSKIFGLLCHIDGDGHVWKRRQEQNISC